MLKVANPTFNLYFNSRNYVITRDIKKTYATNNAIKESSLWKVQGKHSTEKEVNIIQMILKILTLFNYYKDKN